MLFITNLKNNQTIPNNGIIKITENFDEEENYKKEEKIQKIVNNRSIIENSKILLLPNKKNLTFLENSYIHTQTNSEMSNLFVKDNIFIIYRNQFN